MRQNVFFYVVFGGIFLGIRLLFAGADSGRLVWILGPTAWWVEQLSGIPFEYRRELGYVNADFKYLIGPSCAGVRFMIVVMAAPVFSFLHRMGGREAAWQQAFRKKVVWTAGCMIFGYLFTIFVNGIRIVLAIELPGFLREHDLWGNSLTWERLHTAIGAAVYFTALLASYGWADEISRRTGGVPGRERAERKYGSAGRVLFSLLWYFGIALFIPFLSRVLQGRGEESGNFTQYGATVVCVCAAAAVLYGTAAFLRKCLRKKPQ